MRKQAVPIAAAALALGWCLAQAFSSGALAAAVALAALTATSWLATLRRPAPGLRRWLLVITALQAAGIGILLTRRLDGPASLALQLLLLVVLAPLAPAVYASTFGDGER